MKLCKLIPTLLFCGVVHTQAVIIKIDSLSNPPVWHQSEQNVCDSSLWHLADIDHDGLKDTIRVDLKVEASTDLRMSTRPSVSVGTAGKIARGESLTLSVTDVSYTLATGESGKGAFCEFTNVYLSHADEIKINGKRYRDAAKDHPVTITRPKISIKPISSKENAEAVAGVAFKIGIGNDAIVAKKTTGTPNFLAFLSPLLLIFMKKL